MILSDNGRKLIEQFEGCRLTPYQDIAGRWTVGVGHLMLPGEDTTKPITQAQADAFLAQDALFAERIVNTLVKAPLNQNQFDALVSFVYNLGGGVFGASTKLLPALNAGNYDGACNAIGEYFYAGRPRKVSMGLMRRRQAEMKLFSTPVSVPLEV